MIILFTLLPSFYTRITINMTMKLSVNIPSSSLPLWQSKKRSFRQTKLNPTQLYRFLIFIFANLTQPKPTSPTIT